jgi:hypothetical protein
MQRKIMRKSVPILSLAWCLRRGALSFLAVTPLQAPSISLERANAGKGVKLGILQSSMLNDILSGPIDNSDNNGELSSNMYEDYRYASMQPLLQWAVDSGIEFAPGTEIVADSEGDWGIELVQSQQQGTAILTIPSDLILSTRSFEGSQLYSWMKQIMSSETKFLPECLLAVGLLGELSKGESSPWQPWFESLPTDFSTGIFLDSFERPHVQRMAPTLLKEHEKQWETCNSLITKLVTDTSTDNLLPRILRTWLTSQPNLSLTVQWVFSIVLTRSWRTPDGKHAQLVPLGDFLNHHGQDANVRPCIRKGDNALQLCLIEDVNCSCDQPACIHLTYGNSHQPARFLVNFGFCDTSAALIDAQVDQYLARKGLPPISDEKIWPPLDPSQLVVSSENGAVAEDVWVVFLLKVLRERDPGQIQRVQNAYDTDDDGSLDALLDDLFEDWELSVALALKGHFEYLLDNIYPELSFSKEDYTIHPHLSNIVRYNFFMRKVFQQAVNYLNIVADQTTKELSITNK